MYNLPKFNLKNIKNKIPKTFKNRMFWGVIFLVVSVFIAMIFLLMVYAPFLPRDMQGFLQNLGVIELQPQQAGTQAPAPYVSNISYEQAIIDAAKNVSPSVVSIIISKNLPVYEQQYINPFGDLSPGFDILIPQYVQKGTELKRVGAGSGFIVSEDGLVLTNKHVVLDSKVEYAVFTNDGQKYTAKVLALDPVQDLAVIKIETDKKFQPIILGDSNGIQIGQTAIAIGNALGQLSNTVSVGVVSGLERTISASNQAGSFTETLEGIIQTDAAINSGNSGGPLLNLRGEVIGINVAMAQGAEAIGFAIPINMAKKAIEQVVKSGKIVYPFLGIRYVLVDDGVKQKYGLSVDYGAFILRGSGGEAAVTSGSAAEKAGIREHDVVLELNGEKITQDNSLAKIIQKYNAGDKITLHVLRDDEEMDMEATLGERSS